MNNPYEVAQKYHALFTQDFEDTASPLDLCRLIDAALKSAYRAKQPIRPSHTPQSKLKEPPTFPDAASYESVFQKLREVTMWKSAGQRAWHAIRFVPHGSRNHWTLELERDLPMGQPTTRETYRLAGRGMSPDILGPWVRQLSLAAIPERELTLISTVKLPLDK